MRYFAIWDNGIIQTDDYDKNEVEKQLHLKHLCRDLIISDIEDPVRVYDENNRFIRVITQYSFPPLDLM